MFWKAHFLKIALQSCMKCPFKTHWYWKILVLLTLLFSFLHNVFGRYISGTTGKIWLLLEASITNIYWLNSYNCCFLLLTQMGPLVKPFSVITGTTKSFGTSYHAFQYRLLAAWLYIAGPGSLLPLCIF